jgi:hypothetical protein
MMTLYSNHRVKFSITEHYYHSTVNLGASSQNLLQGIYFEIY